MSSPTSRMPSVLWAWARLFILCGTLIAPALLLHPGSAQPGEKPRYFKLVAIEFTRSYVHGDKGVALIPPVETLRTMPLPSPEKLNGSQKGSWYESNYDLDVAAPWVAELGKKVPVKATVRVQMDLKMEAPRDPFAQMSIAFQTKLEADKNRAAGRHAFKAELSQEPVAGDSNRMRVFTRDGVLHFAIGMIATSGIGGGGGDFFSSELSFVLIYNEDPTATSATEPQTVTGRSTDITPTNPTNPTNPISCPATFDGTWHDLGPSGGGREDPGRELGVWGKWIFRQTGNDATGTIDNVGGTFGKSTIKGTVTGKEFRGVWTADNGSGSGTVTATRSDNDCRFTTTWSIDANSTGQTVGTGSRTVGRPGETLNPSTSQGGGNPWDTPQGKECFERWIAEATQKLNAADLGSEGNTRKPWSFDKYGNLVSSGGGGIVTANAPDAWEAHNRNKYWFMWDLYNTDATAGQWGAGHLKTANVPPLRDYVRNCAPGATPGSTREPPLGDGMRLWAPDYQVRKGDRIGVKVYLINGKDVRNLDFSLDYNPGLVAVQGQPVRGAVVTELSESNLERPGLLKFNFARLTPFTQSGSAEVAGFSFEGSNVGRTPLTLALSPGNKLPLSLIHGSILVYEGSRPPGTQWPPPTTQPPGTGWEPTCSGTGRQTINDAQCCLKMWVGLIPTNQSMNLNGDTVVDSHDALIIMDRLAARGN